MILTEIYDNDFEMEEKSRRNNLHFEMEDRKRRNDLHFDGLAEKENETWGDCDRKVQEVLKNGLSIYFVPSEAKDHFENLSSKILSVLNLRSMSKNSEAFQSFLEYPKKFSYGKFI